MNRLSPDSGLIKVLERRSQREPEGARKSQRASQRELVKAREGQREPERARESRTASQREPEGARGSQRELDIATMSQSCILLYPGLFL